ncbi:TonB-dependent receptor [Nostoc sp. 3335mG]|nr:TonB-dependent receptor [Nostoc sp. 3335mG]
MRMPHIKLILAGVSALAMAAPLCAQAPQADAPPPAPAAQGGLQEIVVTATRRNSNLQTTPIAVSAVDSSLIRQAAPRDIGDLASFVPNFSAAKITGFNAASFAMRGVSINNVNVYSEAPVGVLVDDFVMPSVQTQLLDTFDIEQIEVLRGPQGTLFGKNTTGGAVTVHTKRPNLHTFSVEGRASYGSFNEYKLQAAVDVPIVEDKLSVRLVGGYDKSDGYAKNGFCYGPVTPLAPDGSYGAKFAGASGCGDGQDLGGTKVFSGRAKVLFQPSDAVSVLMQYEILRDHSPTAGAIENTSNDPSFLFNQLGVGGALNNVGDPLDHYGATFRDSAYINMHKPAVNVDGFYVNASFDIGPGTFTDVTGYRNQRSRLPSSTTGDGGIYASDGDELSLFDINRSDNHKTFQQELRFASKFGGKFEFVSGLFYQHDTIDFCVSQVVGFLDLVGQTSPYGPYNDNPYVLCSSQRADSTAVYTEGTFKFTDKLTLTLGGRYSWDDKKWMGRQQSFVQDITQNPNMTWQDIPLLDLGNFSKYPEGVVTSRASSSEPTWRASLSYRFSPQVFAYGTYSRGYKGGGYNDQIGSFGAFGSNLDAFAEAAAATKPEFADSFEAGVKTEFFDHHLRTNITGFYVKYRDLQKVIVVPLEVDGQSFEVQRLFNAASATVKGIEAEVTAIPVHGLTLRGNLGYQSGGYNRYVTPIPAGYDLATAPLDRAPKLQWSIDGTYEMPIGDWSAFVNGNVAYTARNLFAQSITAADQNAFLDARTLFNASIGVNGPDNRYSLRLIGRNLTNKRYKTGSLVVGGLWTYTNYAPPRSWMLEGGFKF